MKRIHKLLFLTILILLSCGKENAILSVSNGELKDGHYAVDLGLSVMWATCNIGAGSPEEFGNYFAWGEVDPKERYTDKTYVWGTYLRGNLSKYCMSGRYGKCDNRSELLSEDDAATYNWGGNWRMPTKEDINELIEKCTTEEGYYHGVKGLKVRGPNGNSIFLPAAGHRSDRGDNEAKTKNLEIEGEYWSKSLYAKYIDSSNQAHFLCWRSSNQIILTEYLREDGLSVRAVCPQ